MGSFVKRIPVPVTVDVLHPDEPVHQTAMFNHHSLRLAGGAGGVNHVGQIAGMNATVGGGRIGLGLVAPCRNRAVRSTMLPTGLSPEKRPAR